MWRIYSPDWNEINYLLWNKTHTEGKWSHFCCLCTSPSQPLDPGNSMLLFLSQNSHELKARWHWNNPAQFCFVFSASLSQEDARISDVVPLWLYIRKWHKIEIPKLVFQGHLRNKKQTREVFMHLMTLVWLCQLSWPRPELLPYGLLCFPHTGLHRSCLFK